VANGWLTDREFANFFAIAQALPGPNMILMMSVIGWRVGGLPTAIARACHLRAALRDVLSRAPPLEPLSRRTLAAHRAPGPRPGDDWHDHWGWHGDGAGRQHNWQSVIVTMVAAGLVVRVRVNPLWVLIAAGRRAGSPFSDAPTSAIVEQRAPGGLVTITVAGRSGARANQISYCCDGTLLPRRRFGSEGP
jgi:chromate transporter